MIENKSQAMGIFSPQVQFGPFEGKVLCPCSPTLLSLPRWYSTVTEN